MKKIIQIILILLIVAALIWNIWIIFFRQTTPNPEPENLVNSQPQEELARLSNSKLHRIQITKRAGIAKTNSEEIISQNLSGNLIVINPKEGTEKEIGSSSVFLDFINLEASNKTTLISKIGLVNSTNHLLYSSSSSSWIQLPENTTASTLSPSGEKFALFNNADGLLEVYKYATQETLSTTPLNFFTSKLSWPTENIILAGSAPSQETEGQLLSIDLEAGTISLIKEAFGLTWVDSNNGDTILYLSSTPLSPAALSLLTTTFDQSLSFVTMPEKCTFADEDTFYCAVPIDQTLTEDYPDSYLQRSVYSNDYFIKVDIFNSSVSTTNIFSAEEENILIDAKDLVVIGDKLYFINRYDDQLYELDLAE